MSLIHSIGCARRVAPGPLFARWRREPFLLSPRLLNAFFLVYAVNCIVLYRDRINLDACLFLNSGLLSQGEFFISHGRAFIQLPPQILPWLAIQFGLPLKGVVLAYSLGFCFYHWLMTLLLYYGFRRRDLATLLVLVIALHLAHNNLYIVADGMHIIPWALCMLAALEWPAQRLPGRILAAAGAVLFALITASSHLFGLPLSLALGGYAFFSSDRRRDLLPVLAALTATLMFFYFWRKTGLDDYENAKLSQVGLEVLRRNGPYFVRYFVLANGYALVAIVLLAVLGRLHAAHRGAYWFSMLCALGYAILIASYLPPFTHLYYWHCMIPMYAILAAPFFDARSTTTGTQVCSRVMFAAAMLWAVTGTTANLAALRVRTAFQTHLADALPENEKGDRFFVFNERQLSRDYLSSLLPQYTFDETSLRASCADPAKTTLLTTRAASETGFWAFSKDPGCEPSRYLPWYPARKEAFLPAIIPATRAEILRQAALVSLDCPERPTSVRIIDGWICNYRKPPRMVYAVPVTITNHGDSPLSACDMEDTPVMFGYYWQRDGKILFEDLKAEFLPLNVKTAFQHTINVQRAGIPGDARLAMDLFLNGRPLLHPEAYYGLVPSDQHFMSGRLFDGEITALAGFYNPEKHGVWAACRARFAFNRDLQRGSFTLSPPPNVDAEHPADVVVRCEATGVVFAHRFTKRSPFTFTINEPKSGQTVLITSTGDFCPAREGNSPDTRALALKLSGLETELP